MKATFKLKDGGGATGYCLVRQQGYRLADSVGPGMKASLIFMHSEQGCHLQQ